MGTTRKGSKKSSSNEAKGASLQAAIAASGYSWAAAPTSISALPANERRARLGLTVTDAELSAMSTAIRATDRLAAIRAVSAPSSIDWRNNGGDWTTSIKDQLNCGSCVSFSSIATIESRVKIACKNAALQPDYSEAFLFYCGCGNCCGTGWNFAPALDYCKNTGVASNADFPYTPTNQPCKSGVTPIFKVTAWSSVLPTDERKQIIATKGPVVAGMAVYSDFYQYTSGVYRHVSGALEGYHAVSVVGYDDAQQCWICKNSWGTGWGESGWFKMGYGQSMDTEFAFFDVDVPCPDKTEDTTCEQYLPLLRRVLELARTNALLRQCLRYYVCGRLPRRFCTPAVMRIVEAVLKILKLCPQYRQPFCRALG
jgi:C1A family cysteine protease